MFETKNLPRYAIILGVILVVTAFSNNIKTAFETDNDYEMIKKYLLNESPLYGFNRPKIWIHSKYEVNSRQWKDFHSRNTTNLNQNYIHLTIKTIINHCGEDFNICLIDDESFSKLLTLFIISLKLVSCSSSNIITSLFCKTFLFLPISII